MRRFFLSLSLLLMPVFSYAMAVDLFSGIDQVTPAETASAPAPVLVSCSDPNLQKQLTEASRMASNPFRMSRADTVVFLRFGNTFIRKQLKRDSRDSDGYTAFVKSKVHNNLAIEGFSFDGKRSYKILHDKSKIQKPEEELSFADCAVAGLVFKNERFPLFYNVLSKAYDEGRVAAIYGADGGIEELKVPQGEAHALIFLARFADRREFIVVAKADVPVSLQKWTMAALHNAFYKYFVCDHKEQLITTDKRMNTFHGTAVNWQNKLRLLRNAVNRVRTQGQDNWFMAENGTYVDYDKRVFTKDQYRYKEDLSRELAKVKKEVISDNTQKHASLIFGRPVVKKSYVGAVSAVSEAHGIVQANSWQALRGDAPNEDVLRPFVVANTGINGLSGTLKKEYPVHSERLQAFINSWGEVLIGYAEFNEARAFQDFKLDK